jgi:hypothetical protein
MKVKPFFVTSVVRHMFKVIALQRTALDVL